MSDTSFRRISSRQRHWIRWLACLILCLLLVNLFYLGRQPVAVGLFTAPWDKLAHFALFAALAILIALVLSGGISSLSWLMGVAFILSIFLGALDEGLQTGLPGREAGLDDLFADALGAVSGLWCTHGMLRDLLRSSA